MNIKASSRRTLAHVNADFAQETIYNVFIMRVYKAISRAHISVYASVIVVVFKRLPFAAVTCG